MSSVPQKIAIIGGGISGLTLAYRLHQKKTSDDIHLFEKSKDLGGIIQTENRNGFVLEKGPDGFLQQKTTVRDLAKELGIENELIATKTENRRSLILQNNQLIEVPDGFYLMSPSKIFPFLQSPLLSWKGKLRTLCEILIPPKKNNTEESLAAFVRRRFGRENLEKISQAMLGGIYTADPETLSMQAAMPRFVEMEKNHGSIMKGILKTMSSQENISGARYGLFGSFRDGMSTLVEALQNKIPAGSFHTNTPVEKIHYDSQTLKWKLYTNQIEQNFDRVFFALPPYQIANIFENLTENEKHVLQSIPYASSALFHFGFKSSQIRSKPNAVGFIVPHKEHKHFIACSFISDKYENRAPAGFELIRVFAGGALQENLLQMPTTELRSKIFQEVSKILDIQGEPILEDFAAWPQSMPQYTMGHLQRVEEIQNIFKKFPNVSLLGNAYKGVGIPDLIDRVQTTVNLLY